MLKRAYDVVIFGDGLCGLLTAAVLNDSGAKVLLLHNLEEVRKEVKGYLIDGQMFPPGNIPDVPAVTKILGRIGIGLSNKAFFQPVSPIFQVVTGKRRIDVHDDLDKTAEEFGMEFGKDAGNIVPLLEEGCNAREALVRIIEGGGNIFPPHTIKNRILSGVKKKLIKGGALSFYSEEKLDGAGLSPELKKVFQSFLEFSLPLRPLPGELPAIPLQPGSGKCYYPKEGMGGLKRLFVSKLKEKGVDVHHSKNIKSFDVQKNMVTAISLAEKDQRVLTKTFIFNAPVPTLRPLLPETFSTRHLRETLAGETPWGYWRSIYIGINADKIPVGMSDNLVVEDSSGGTFLMQLSPSHEETVAPAGKRLLKISRSVPLNDSWQDRDVPDDSSVAKPAFETFEKDCLGLINDLIPFLEGDFDIIQRSDDEAASADNYILRGPLKGPLGIGTLSPLTCFKNFFITGKEIMPVLGIEGDFLSATIIADHILKIIAEPEE